MAAAARRVIDREAAGGEAEGTDEPRAVGEGRHRNTEPEQAPGIRLEPARDQAAPQILAVMVDIEQEDRRRNAVDRSNGGEEAPIGRAGNEHGHGRQIEQLDDIADRDPTRPVEQIAQQDDEHEDSHHPDGPHHAERIEADEQKLHPHRHDAGEHRYFLRVHVAAVDQVENHGYADKPDPVGRADDEQIHVRASHGDTIPEQTLWTGDRSAPAGGAPSNTQGSTGTRVALGR